MILKSFLFIFFLSMSIAGTGPVASVAMAGSVSVGVAASSPENLHQQITQIKANPRGPFQRIRWFCNDGTILPPRPYACRDHGGGVQHGEWSAPVKSLRTRNYLIANLMADLHPETFFSRPDWRSDLKQIMLERFMMAVDDGWVFRQARYYRGAIQDEVENGFGRALLLGLLDQPFNGERDYFLWREAVRRLPHGQTSSALTQMRELSQTLAEEDEGFTRLRTKLHNQPDADDVARIKDYAVSLDAELRPTYLQLAELVAAATAPSTESLRDAAQLDLIDLEQIESQRSEGDQLGLIGRLLIKAKAAVESADAMRRLELIDLSLALEDEFYRHANRMLKRLEDGSRRDQLELIAAGLDALHGSGMLSQREYRSQKTALSVLRDEGLTVADYQRESAHLARMGRWAENRLRFHFEGTVNWMRDLDRGFDDYIPERLRSSPLLAVTRAIDRLQADSRHLTGVSRHMFGRDVVGLKAINPGLARGQLEVVADPLNHDYKAGSIYLLPETLESLPPVSGILTRGEGNSLSHIQLLARNLGIPNIAVSAERAAELKRHEGEILVIAAGADGTVKLQGDSPGWQKFFRRQQRTQYLIEPDLDKLDLNRRAVIPLGRVGADDSGRIAGPKGANLGELEQIYPDLVPDALVIPFGRFAQVLEQTRVADGRSLKGWMKDNYGRLEQLSDPEEKQRQTEAFLAQLRAAITKASLPQDFISELKAALAESFGGDGSYGVFVRSDTNIEDLPGFSGAGLNKTVPHVVGFDNILAAIRKVWASPFSLRAYSWRQGHMRQPEHVYASVLLMLSVPAEKSGVLVTTDLSGGDPHQLHVAVNEGIGGAVSGQRAEEILIAKEDGRVRLLSQASASQKRILLPEGGLKKIMAVAPQSLLTESEIGQLRQMAARLPARFPSLHDSSGNLRPADIEFGFIEGRFVLFQIRPLVESKRLKNDLYLAQMSSGDNADGEQLVDLDRLPWRPQP